VAIRAMAWDEFESQLSRSARRDTSRRVPDQALRDHFGPEKLERLPGAREEGRAVVRIMQT